MPEDHDHRIRILHISDLHIGEAPAKEDEKPKHFLLTLDAPPTVLANTVKQIVDDHGEHGEDFTADFLVVTGDLITQAAERGERQARYEAAHEQLDALCQAVGIRDKSHVLITPGNHDVLSPKTDKDVNDCTRLDDYLDFVRSFYSGTPDNKNPSLFSLESDENGIRVRRTRWCMPYDEGIVFWPLVTCDFSEHEENQEGVCSDYQLSKGEASFRVIPNKADRCCIAIAHHNFLPATGDQIKRGRRGHSRKSMSALQFFFKHGVMIVLHGHRHQDYALGFGEWEEAGVKYSNTRLLVGAPSIGYYQEGKESDHNLAGFAVIDLYHSAESTHAALRKYRLRQRQNRQWYAQPPDVRIRTLRRPEGLPGYMTFSEGYRKFAAEVLDGHLSDKRVIILHYHDDTQWHDAFRRFWKLDEPDDFTNKALDQWLEPIGRDLLESGYLGDDLKDALLRDSLGRANLYSHVIRTVTGAVAERDVKEDLFLAHLCEVAHTDTQGARVVTYIAEAMYCAANPSIDFRKHVYFSPLEEKREEMRAKFIWLLESIMLARNLTNFNVSWLPYAIAGYQGKSLVGIHDQDDQGQYGETFYVGFDPETDPHRYSVLRLPRDLDRDSAEGPILDDLKALMRKVINPLSQRLADDFPVFMNGRVSTNTLCCMAFAINANDIWAEDIGKRFVRAFNIRPQRCRPSARCLRRLENLYAWVVRNSVEHWNIPWTKEGKALLMASLQGTVRQ